MNRALLLTYGRPVLWRGAGDPVPAGTESAVSAITATPTTTGPAVLVLAEERSVFYATAPTYRAITEAFQSARLAGPEATRGNWVGPGPRVTRTATVGERFGTFAAWVYQWPPGTTPTEATVEQLRTSVKNAVDNVVTEYGVAELHGQPVSVRARRLIDIAHPKFRDELEAEARASGYLRG